jgi:hypothetical protein
VARALQRAIGAATIMRRGYAWRWDMSEDAPDPAILFTI